MIRRIALSLLSLLLLPASFAVAQTTTVVTLGNGVCNTSSPGNYFCTDILVSGIGTPGHTYAAFFVSPRSGPVTGTFSILDYYTNTFYTAGGADPVIPPSNDSATSITLFTADGWAMQGIMGTTYLCGRYQKPPNCPVRPKFMGGTAALTVQ